MSAPRVPDEPERDAWLSQALRHAPDAGSDAPAALSEAILREARSALARPPAPAEPMHRRSGVAPRFAAFWGWLARPPVAAGFASVMVATLVGLLWWDRPLEEALPRATAPLAPAPQVEAAPAVVADARPVARVAAPNKEEGAGATATRAAPVAPPAAAAPQRAGRVAAATPAPVPALETSLPMPRAAAPAPPPAPVLEAEAARRREDGATTAQPAGALSEATADKAAPRRSESRPAAQGNAALAKARPADAGSAPLAEVLAGITRQPERWRWQRGNGAAQPMNPALQRWLVQLEGSTSSHWRPAPEPVPHDPARTLRLLRDGAPVATLGFAGGGVWAETADTAAASVVSMAPLQSASLESLRAGLDEAAP